MHIREVAVWLYPYSTAGAVRRWVVRATPRPLYPLEGDSIPI